MSVHRHPDQREKDLVELARRYLMGETQTAIAADLGVTQQTISDDLKLIRKRWRKSAIRDFDEAIALELAKIDLVESELWQQWERSKKPRRTKRDEEGTGDRGASVKTVTIESSGLGDPRYLEGVMKCIDRRCRLLGLDAELKYQDLTIAIGKTIQAGYVVENPKPAIEVQAALVTS
ncbi:hypothetical protein ACQ4M3_05165 [Leptolyngbya sp. AN03gr2]|uniref:hypothetical protein n=1 Tax=unclassified Leptolyngbya TaxID=2650499 RepID=UPI003D3203D6